MTHNVETPDRHGKGGGEGIPRTQPAGQLTYKKKIINFVFPCGHIPRHTEFSRPSRTRGAPQGNPGWTPGRTLLKYNYI